MELREDKLRGVREIAGHIGESERRTVYMLERKQIPGFKIGRIWHSTRTALKECFTVPMSLGFLVIMWQGFLRMLGADA